MFESYVSFIRAYLPQGRSRKIMVNVTFSAILKVVNMLISFIMVPITLSYLDKTRYGLWSALSSFIAWYFLFDLGVGTGLRNKFTEMKASGNEDQIKYYVSTAYFVFIILSILMIIVFYLTNLFIDWSKLLNAPSEYSAELSKTALSVFAVLAMSFSVKLITSILSADLKNATSEGISTLGHLLSLGGIVLLNRYSTPSLLWYALMYTGINLVVTLGASIILYMTTYREYAPRISAIRLRMCKYLLRVGINFFVIRIIGLVMFRSTPFLISNLLGPESVTTYTIHSQYYSVSAVVIAFFTQPLWTGYGDAYFQGDYLWIRKTFKRMRILWALIVVGMLVMLLLQKPIFSFWLKGRVDVDLKLSILFVAFNALFSWGGIYNLLLNATSRLRVQLYLNSIMAIAYIGFAIFLVKVMNIGVYGIMVALTACMLPTAILYPIQCDKILSHAGGVWEK